MSEQDRELPPIHRRARWHSFALGCVILLCGIAIGGVLSALFLRGPHEHGMRRDGPMPEFIAQKMQHKYGLSNEQRQQLVTIFNEHGKKLAGIRSEVQPRVEAEHESLRRAVDTVLTPEQATQWHKEFEQFRRPWRHRGEEMPPPPPPPDEGR